MFIGATPFEASSRACNVCQVVRPEYLFKRKPRGPYNELPRCFKTCNMCSSRIKKRKVETRQQAAASALSTAIKHVTDTDKQEEEELVNAHFVLHTVLHQRFRCVFCGVPLPPSRGFLLNRVDASVGHTKRNCVLCCAPCGSLRADDYAFDEFLQLMHALPSAEESDDVNSVDDGFTSTEQQEGSGNEVILTGDNC